MICFQLKCTSPLLLFMLRAYDLVCISPFVISRALPNVVDLDTVSICLEYFQRVEPFGVVPHPLSSWQAGGQQLSIVFFGAVSEIVSHSCPFLPSLA